MPACECEHVCLMVCLHATLGRPGVCMSCKGTRVLVRWWERGCRRWCFLRVVAGLASVGGFALVAVSEGESLPATRCSQMAVAHSRRESRKGDEVRRGTEEIRRLGMDWLPFQFIYFYLFFSH